MNLGGHSYRIGPLSAYNNTGYKTKTECEKEAGSKTVLGDNQCFAACIKGLPLDHKKKRK